MRKCDHAEMRSCGNAIIRKCEEAAVPNLDIEPIVRVLDGAPASLTILYGSHARGDATPNSDIDLAVEFEKSLSSTELTRTRLGLIERLTTELESHEIDVVPLSRVHAELLDEILADGILIYGSPENLDQYQGRSVEVTSRRDRIAEFDDLLTELERVV